MRNNFKKLSWALWLVIITFVVGFSAISAFTSGSGTASDLATVDKTVIKIRDFYKYLSQVMENYRQQMKENFNKDLIVRMGVPEQILQSMINTAIIKNESKKLDIIITEDEISQRIRNYSGFQRDGEFIGFQQAKLALEYARVNLDDFTDELRDNIRLTKLRELVTSPLVIDEETLKEEYKKEKDRIELEMVRLKTDRVTAEITPKNEELVAYFRDNKDAFKSPEKRIGTIVSLKYDDFKDNIKISDKEKYDYFDENKEMFSTPGKTVLNRIFMKYDEHNAEEVEKKIADLRKTLNKNNFEEMAKIHSEGEKAKDGGNWGEFEWKQKLHKNELDKVDALSHEQISQPIDTFQGFSILFMKEKKVAGQKPFGEVEKQITDTIERKKLHQLVQEKLMKIRQKIQNNNLKESAEKRGFDYFETAPLASGDAIKDLDETGFISMKLFQMTEDEIVFPVDFIKGMAIIQLTKIEPPATEKFDNVREQVREKYIRQEKVKQLLLEGKQVSGELNRLADSKKQASYLEKNKLKSESVTYRRGNKLSNFPVKGNLDELLFSLAENRFSSPIQFENEIVIVRPKSITTTGLIEYETDREDFYGQKMKSLKENYFISYIIAKRKKYKISLNQKLFEDVKSEVLSRFN